MRRLAPSVQAEEQDTDACESAAPRELPPMSELPLSARRRQPIEALTEEQKRGSRGSLLSTGS